MFKINMVSMTVVSLFAMTTAFADGLSHDVDELQITAETLVGEVNANAAAIAVNASDISSNTAAVNAVSEHVATILTPAVYDYKNYTTTVSSKTFSMKSPAGGCGDTETRTFSRVVNGDVTNLKVNRVRTIDGNVCHTTNFNYILTPVSKKFVSSEVFDFAGNLYSTNILSKPFTVATSSMVEGKSFGGATGIKNQVVGGSPVLISAFVNTVTVEKVQNVTVPAGTFTGCIKVHTVRTSGVIGNFNRYSWFCPGIGEVKRTQINPVNLNARFWKLTSYTP